MSDTKLIYQLIPKIMKEVGAIGKLGFNEFDKYKFRSIDDVYNKLQPVLASNGVFFVPNVLESSEEKIKSAAGKDQVRVKIRVNYKIFACDGSGLDAVVDGEAVDRSDKATNKALTAAFKYMLIQVFCIAVEGMDDADKESPELNFVPEKQAEPEVVKPQVLKTPKQKMLKITQGKFKGKMLSEVLPKDLAAYIVEVSDALKSSGRVEPKWFTEIRQAAEL